MRRPIGIVGLGELGTLFAEGLLKLGRPVLPVLRGEPARALVSHDPELVLIAVAEPDLDEALGAVPSRLRDRVALLQNELSPADWTTHGITRPTVASVWFEKKKGRLPSVVRESDVAGPFAELLVEAATKLGLASRVIDERELPAALVRKNLYVVGSNLAGLRVGGTTGELASKHRAFATDVLREVLAVECARLGTALPPHETIAQTLADFALDPTHAAMGRSAPARLARTLERAEKLGVTVPTLRTLREGSYS